MRNKVFQFLFLISPLFLFTSIQAQKGNPLIRNYSTEKVNSLFWSIEENANGLMFLANREGVFTFDGSIWDKINIPSLTFTLKQYNEKLLIGCRNEFGEIIQTQNGEYIYKPFYQKPDSLGDISSIEVEHDKLFFGSDNSITVFNSQKQEVLHQFIADSGQFFSGLIKLNDEIFVFIQYEGLYKITEDSLQIVTNDTLYSGNELLFSLNFNSQNCLLAFDNGLFYLFDGQELTPFVIKDSEYLKESIVDNGISFSDSLFIISTLNGGALVLEKDSGKTLYTLNFQTGLPDDEIFAIGKDKFGGLWLSNEYGVSRVDLSYPVQNFSFYPGLKGNLNDVIEFNNTIYVSSGEGVFYLTEIKDFTEKEVTVKIKTKPKVPKKTTTVKQKEEIDLSKLSKKERRRLKWKKATNKLIQNIGESIVNVATEEPKNETAQKEYRLIKKKIYSLQSISHGYKKIPGLDSKCKDLLISEGKLFVTTNNGLYQISENKIIPILTGVYIQQVYPFLNNLYIGTNNGIYLAQFTDDKWITEPVYKNITGVIYSLCITNNNFLFVGSDNIVYKINIADSLKKPAKYLFDNSVSLKIMVRLANEKPLFFTRNGVYELKNDSLKLSDNSLFQKSVSGRNFIFSQNNRVWVRNENSWFGIPESNNQLEINPLLLNLINNIESIYTENGDVIWAISTDNSIYKIKGEIIKSQSLNVFFKSVKNDKDERFPFGQLKVKYTNSALHFTLSAPYFINPESTQYQYYIIGLMNDWSKWSQNENIEFPFIPPGNYTISVRAKNVLGTKSEIRSLSFTVKPPFWTAWWFYLLVITAFIAVAYAVFQLRMKKLQHDKKVLEQKVKERTAEIERQKEEIIDQKDEIEAQRDMVTEQRDEILKQKEEITASIMYAQRIQNAVLPPQSMIKDSLSDHFILFKPRDIVSGDFYWMKQIGETTIITAADCTGHGVPGAFMSMLGMTLLNEIVRNKEITQANHVLDELRNQIKLSLRQTGKEGEAKDGMDIALCVIDHKKKILQFAGAYNPLYLYRNNELMEIKADRMPIGVYIKDNEPFTNHEIKLKKGDTFYLFSDGFVDQFGGEKGNKFKTKAFKQLLLDIHSKPMPEQKEELNSTFENWRGKHDQIDDVLVIGIRI
ncbi:MAG: SpoIIE family protein phosphatase [Chlorobi bacterium]|nr:SpoIIE family protein phosphatase [Chlorobiota bacterium]